MILFGQKLEYYTAAHLSGFFLPPKKHFLLSSPALHSKVFATDPIQLGGVSDEYVYV
jgi:hypothetical protein